MKPLADAIVTALQDRKAKDIVVLDLQKLSSRPVDYFIVCHGESDRQVEAFARAIEEETREALQEKPWHVEGLENKEWVLLDYVDIVVHIFQKEQRDFYAIEDLWGDAEAEHIPNR